MGFIRALRDKYGLKRNAPAGNSLVSQGRPQPQQSLVGGANNVLSVASQTANATKASYPR